MGYLSRGVRKCRLEGAGLGGGIGISLGKVRGIGVEEEAWWNNTPCLVDEPGDLFFHVSGIGSYHYLYASEEKDVKDKAESCDFYDLGNKVSSGIHMIPSCNMVCTY